MIIIGVLALIIMTLLLVIFAIFLKLVDMKRIEDNKRLMWFYFHEEE